MINNVVDEILLNEMQKVSVARKATEFMDSDYVDNGLYQVDKMRLEGTKRKLEWSKRAFECELKIHMGLKI